MNEEEQGEEGNRPAAQPERRPRRFSGSLIQGSLYVFLCLGLTTAGLGLGLAYNPLLLVLSAIAIVVLLAYLTYVLLRRRPWKKPGLGPPLFLSSHRKVSAADAHSNTAADDADDTVCNHFSTSARQDGEAVSSKTYIVVK